MSKTVFFQSKKSYFPQISRLFTEHLFFWVIFGVFVGVLASFLTLKPLYFHDVLSQIDLTQLASRKDEKELTRSYEEWKRIVEAKPEYRDAFVMLAWYAKELGKTEEEKIYIQKIIALDPSYSIPEVFLMEK
jgi:hypothetical protein